MWLRPCAALVAKGKCSLSLVREMHMAKEKNTPSPPDAARQGAKATQRLLALFDLSQRMVSILDLEKVEQYVVTTALELLGGDGGSLMLLDEAAGELRIEAAVGLDKGIESAAAIKLGEGISGWVAREGKPLLLLGDAGEDGRFSDVAARKDVKCAISVPLLIGERVLGVLNVSKATDTPGFGEDDVQLLSALANHAAIAIQNARLYSEIEHAYMELKAMQLRLTSLFEHANDAVLVIDSESFKIVKVNRQAEQLTGYGRDELTAMPVAQLSHPQAPNALENVVRQTVSGGSVHFDDTSLARKDGSRVSVRISASVVSYGESKVVQAFLGDITARKKLEEKLARAEKLRLMGEMARGMAHEFNNILGGILGNVQLMRRQVQDERLQKTLGIVEEAARHGAATVKRMQEFTQVRTDKEFEPVDLNQMIRDIVAEFRVSRKTRRRFDHVSVEVSEGQFAPGAVAGSPSDLREALTNILLNALEAIPDKGSIAVKTWSEEGAACVSVADTGVGMSDASAARIFEPFFSTKGRDGLGLSVAYGIVRRHGGRIGFDTKEGQGTTFTVRIPLRAMAAPKATEAAQPVSAKGRILVVDDEQLIRDVLEKMLTSAGHEVAKAGSVQDALAALERGRFDLVLTDLGMPGLSGWDLAKTVKARKDGTAVALITGWGVQLDEAKVAECGVDFVIGKPFEDRRLYELVAKAVANVKRIA